MSFFLNRCARIFRQGPTRFLSTSTHPIRNRVIYRNIAWGTAALGVAAGLAVTDHTIHLDSQVQDTIVQTNAIEETTVDPATSIAFPKTMRVPMANVKVPPLTLVGVGVRTVSFLGVKVYSIGFYADLSNPDLKVPLELSPEEKVRHIVQNTACVIRIVPTRSTSYTHLRDAFMRALQARLARGIKEGTITEDTAQATSSPLRDLKGLFPNSPLAKHTALDIFLSPPSPSRTRALIFRDLGSVENDWVATEFVLNYFDREAPSPALKNNVLENLKSFQK
ncbi:hypothetical protein D9613_001663 [Agrocybe pediades]|uniref:Chalcone isomerase domain-containing protein n=1 Tax=Agrocybe pediades TaxID=84607 RepID=A0A8H4R7C4_9AGAR|nr:hypothetical protein D9613_001663 [Agrocybe pediades]